MATITVSNESEASFSRLTKDGRKLTYELRVLQQPQRARACGSGAKSSADRRPVDPPPVIELRVFEGEHRLDITFNHKANFFVYTTLETARTLAHARGQPVAQPPVLTGSPVSGAALLDRPTPAAYFIFPDLSVRHEGMYRLNFGLFEELKDSKDEDMHAPIANVPHAAHAMLGGAVMGAQAYVHFRLEVRSKPFTVYSAKKFPGLTESTHLSRVVAEQGCRVRIRRDVRMRRRETKGSKASSEDSEVNYSSYSEPASADLYRQPSLEQLQQQHNIPQPSIEHNNYYQQQAYPTPPYSQPAPLPPYMSQSRPSSQQQYHPIQNSPIDHPSPQSQTSAYSHQYNQYSSHQPHTRAQSFSSTHDGSVHGTPNQTHVVPQPAYTTPYGPIGAQDPAGLGAKSLFWHEQQNAAQTLAVENPYMNGAQHHNQNAQAHHQNAQTQHQSSHCRNISANDVRAAATNLPPLKTLQPAAVLAHIKHDARPLAPSMMNEGPMPDIYNMSGASAAASVRAGTKRSYHSVFDAGRSTGIANGCRQDQSGQDIEQIPTDDGMINVDELLNMRSLMYRRANGDIQTKTV